MIENNSIEAELVNLGISKDLIGPLFRLSLASFYLHFNSGRCCNAV